MCTVFLSFDPSGSAAFFLKVPTVSPHKKTWSFWRFDIINHFLLKKFHLLCWNIPNSPSLWPIVLSSWALAHSMQFLWVTSSKFLPPDDSPPYKKKPSFLSRSPRHPQVPFRALIFLFPVLAHCSALQFPLCWICSQQGLLFPPLNLLNTYTILLYSIFSLFPCIWIQHGMST